MEGRSYQRDRYVGWRVQSTREDKPSRAACLLPIKLLCGALPGGGKHKELSFSCLFPNIVVGRTLSLALVLSPWPLALMVEVVDARGGGVLLCCVPLGNCLPTV